MLHIFVKLWCDEKIISVFHILSVVHFVFLVQSVSDVQHPVFVGIGVAPADERLQNEEDLSHPFPSPHFVSFMHGW